MKRGREREGEGGREGRREGGREGVNIKSKREKYIHLQAKKSGVLPSLLHLSRSALNSSSFNTHYTTNHTIIT